MRSNRKIVTLLIQAQTETNPYVDLVELVNPMLESIDEPLTDRSYQSISRNISKTVEGSMDPVSAHLSEVVSFARDGIEYVSKGKYRHAGMAFFGVPANIAGAMLTASYCAKISEHNVAIRCDSNFDLVDAVNANYNRPKI